jgi:putative MATE family efflux protein
MKNHRLKAFIRDPRKALFTLAWPVMFGMLVQALYNVVDTAYVGRLGHESIAALTFAFPIFFILIALNSGISVGVNSRIARFIGEKKRRAAENTATHGILLSIVLAFAVFIFGFIFLDDLFMVFGADASVLSISMDYMSIILGGVFFMFPAFVIASIFAGEGDTRTPMIMQVVGLVLNIILDPIFIYTLGLGVQGAAIATVISLFAGFLVALYYLETRSTLKVSMNVFRFSRSIVFDVFRVGAPAAAMMLFMSFYVIFLNRVMAHFGTMHVAAFGIAMRLDGLAFMPIAGFAMAALTLVGMFYGAKRYDLMEGIIWFTVKVGAGFTFLICSFLFFWPSLFLRIFTSDPELIAIGAPYIRIVVFMVPFAAVGMVISRAMQGMGVGLPGFVINLIRTFLVSVPLAYVLVFIFGSGYLAVPLSMFIGAFVGALVALVWIVLKLRGIRALAS